ncbi:MAG: hypothetical protein ACLSAH_15570 [Bilophila wadsworthia]
MKTTTRIHASPVSDKNGQRPDTLAGFRQTGHWLDGLIAERGSRNTVAAYRQIWTRPGLPRRAGNAPQRPDDETSRCSSLGCANAATRPARSRGISSAVFSHGASSGELASTRLPSSTRPNSFPPARRADKMRSSGCQRPDATSKPPDQPCWSCCTPRGAFELIELQPIDLDPGASCAFWQGEERLSPCMTAMRMAEYLKIFSPFSERTVSSTVRNGLSLRSVWCWSNYALEAGIQHFPTRSGTPSPPTCWKAGRSPFRADSRPCGHDAGGSYARPVRTPAPDPQEIPSPVPARRARPG